jgi:serine protease Do
VSALPGLEPSPHLAAVADRLRLVTVEVEAAGGGGAGVLWAPDLVVTSAHVVRGDAVRVTYADGRHVPARPVAVDRRVDLALLRVPRLGVAPAVPGHCSSLRVGALVVALGHPLGLRRTLTAGVVHAVPSPGRRWIEADLRLAPGNSGGPLADAAGQVVGINAMIAGGRALAIPVEEVRRVVDLLRRGAT